MSATGDQQNGSANHEFQWEDEHLEFSFKSEIPGKVKMQTRKLDLYDWIKIDKTYPAQMALREKLKAEKFDKVFVSKDSESTMEAKQELLETLGEYLPERFPEIFQKNQKTNEIYNKFLKRTTSLERNDELPDPLIRAGDLTQEDFAILEYSEEEQAYVLTTGIAYFPMRWSLREKFMKPMKKIHRPVIPFIQQLYPNVHSLFNKMRPDTPMARSNWAIFNDLEGPLDLYTPLGHQARNGVNQKTVFDGEKTGDRLVFRAEYQTLRKLPKTKAIVFSIRTYQRFLSDFKRFEPEDRAGLIKSINTLDPNMYIYKGAKFWKDAALEYLKLISQNDPPQKMVGGSNQNEEQGRGGLKQIALIGCGLALVTISVMVLVKNRK